MSRFFIHCRAALAILLLTAPLAAQDDDEKRRMEEAMNREISQKATRLLGEFFLSGGVPADVLGTSLAVSGRTFTLRGRLEILVDAGQHHRAGVVVDVDVDGREEKALRLGSVGLAASPKEAIDQALFDWAQLLGPGIAVVADPSLELPQEMSHKGWRVLAGNTLIRGGGTGDWLDGSPAMHRLILDAAAPHLGAASGGFVTLELGFAVDAKNGVRSECKRHGEPSEELCESLRGLEWAADGADFMLKQFYVLIPGG